MASNRCYNLTQVIETKKGKCENYGKISAHSLAILQIAFTRDSSMIASGSADASVCLWDVVTGARVKKYTHAGIVNAVDTTKRGTEMIASASDDGSVKVWDQRYVERAKRVTVVRFKITGKPTKHHKAVD
jgi:WD40 repeat protein